MMTGARILDERAELEAIAHPTRVRILEMLREPDSAAGVARRLGEPRQRVNHHVKELARVGLLESVGERRRGNFTEQLYRSAARTYLISPRLTWAGQDRTRVLADQSALEHLVGFGERLQRDAAELLDEAAFDGRVVPSVTVETEVRFADPDARAAFLDEYMAMLGVLVQRHAAAAGDAYRLGLVTYPQPGDER